MNQNNAIPNSEKFAKTQPYPEQNNPDRIASPMGVELKDSETLKMKEKLEARDENRFMLDPDSADRS